MIFATVFMGYTFMIALFGKEVGMLFATIGLAFVVAMGKLSTLTGLDKKIDEWLEKE